MQEVSVWKRFDIQGLILAVVSLLVLLGTSFVKPTPLYIPQNDSNSDFPYLGKSTISTALVIVLIVVLGLAAVVGLYFLARFFPSVFRSFNIWSAIWNLGTTVGITISCVNVFKNMVGRARPDIYGACGKDFSSADPKTCPNLTESDFNDMFRSWPSGHSASSMSGFGYIGFLVQGCISWSSAIATAFASLWFIFAIYIGATRIVDYRHHPDDVIAGFFIGFLFLVLIWQRSKEDIFSSEEKKVESGSENHDNSANAPSPL